MSSEGQIMEIGNHDELIANDGDYKHLMQQQMIEEKKQIEKSEEFLKQLLMYLDGFLVYYVIKIKNKFF